MKLSIIIPVYNEEKTISEVVREVNDVVIPEVKKEIIIVNDCSTDNTESVLNKIKQASKDLIIINHEKNKGKGAAVRTGFSHATGDYVIIQDADLEYNPQDFKKLIKPIVKGEAQVVYGTRLKKMPDLSGHGTMSKTRFLLHFFGNRFLSLITSILYLQWITDMETCYKIFPRKFLKKVTLNGEGFNFEPEITAKLVKSGYKIVELPITTKPRGYNEGKKLQTFPEGFSALWTLLKYRFV
ncbi:MAG: glycosyltransferase family 2 protein [Candidatus Levybacteria bacterium]|nr:glycosyltransferase family 2 protein [Candidatus Levybacteria bacterium]